MYPKLLSEFLGTSWLVLGGCGSAVLAGAFPTSGIAFAGVSLAFGLTLLTGAYALGPRSGAIPALVRVFLDSPMAISATEIFRRHPECFNDGFLAELQHGDPFAMPGLHFTRDTSESMAINSIDGGAIILAGSGTCNGGRVRHHLKHNLWRERSSAVFVGDAAQGTLARRIVDGAATVRIFSDEIAVRAGVHDQWFLRACRSAVVAGRCAAPQGAGARRVRARHAGDA